ncbi:cytochrome c4 [Burkholderia multivorans]|uniref:c-type cytochrome n=1 Tax=Burkholderia ubonensis TaxID=101571 RepID=UPI000F6FADD2|nr:c-type cytochrome [Burkholderia ubonensis]AYZ62619.1 cytochrome c4 [Burkholderia multivorans]VWC13345.1 cytochrome c family protein [Burkholderia ubonensis]
MKHMVLRLLPAILLAGTGCDGLEQSRAIDRPAVAGRTIAQQVCSNCHGANGISVSPMFPKLAAQPREYLIAQLTDFRNHRRADPNAQKYMWGVSRLSDTQIEQLAAYFSSQPPAPGKPGDPPRVDLGRAIFASGLPDQGVAACITCHGLHGEGAGGVPRLAGQHADYIMKQLLVFRHSGQRPRGEPMKAVSDNLSEQEMRAVAAYLETLATGPLRKTSEVTGTE